MTLQKNYLSIDSEYQCNFLFEKAMVISEQSDRNKWARAGNLPAISWTISHIIRSYKDLNSDPAQNGPICRIRYMYKQIWIFKLKL